MGYYNELSLSPRTIDDDRYDRIDYGMTTAPRARTGATFKPASKPATCRDCKVRFEDFGGHRLCDACLVEYVNGAGELELDDDLFINVAPANRTAPRRRKCVVCGMSALAGDLCGYCREDLPALLASLTSQQDTIIARMRQQQIDLDLHISCANDDEKVRYAALCRARALANTQHELGSNRALEDFNKRYLATQALPDTLGAIVRADSKVSDQWRDVEALNSLQSKIASVELAIEGLKESA